VPEASTLGLLALACCGVVVLTVLHRQHVAAVRRDRAGLFENCSGLLTDASVVPRGLDFPVLAGRRGSRSVRVEPVVDALTMRTVPVLWMVVTVGLPQPVRFRLSVLARSCGTEFYARHGDAGGLVATGPGWPEELAVRSDRPDLVKAHAGLLDRIALFMADGRAKQVALGGSTARVVWRCASAVPSSYRVTRRVDLTGARIDPTALDSVLDTMTELESMVTRPASSLAGEVRR
jgi:hypothetical protein